MTALVIVDRATRRVLFVKDAGTPSLLEGLWPLAGFKHLRVHDSFVPQAAWATPWNFEFRKQVLAIEAPAATVDLAWNKRRAEALCALARAIEGRRLLFCKTLMGQDKVYEAKAEEAQLYLSCLENGLQVDTTKMPFLSEYAEDEALTLKSAAHMILIKREQEKEVLVETERQRRKLSKMILGAYDSTSLSEAEALIGAYERDA